MPTKQNKVITGRKGVKPVFIRGIDMDFWWRLKSVAAGRGMTIREFVIDSCARNMKGGAE